MEIRQHLQQTVLAKPNSSMKNEIRSLSLTVHENQLPCIQDLNVGFNVLRERNGDILKLIGTGKASEQQPVE